MSKVLIDRALLSVASLHLEYSGYTETGKKLRALLDTPSGTPVMPVKAYYYESGNLDGIRTRSVGLEVRKAFIDAPLVLESDAMECITYLEVEIAKRDARIVELDKKYGWALSELAAIKAQEPVAWAGAIEYGVPLLMVEPQNWKATPLYAAPVSEAKAQGVVMPERDSFMAGVKAASDKVKAIVEDYDQRHGSTDPDTGTREYPGNGDEWVCCMLELIEDFTGIVAPSSLNAAPAAPAADAGLVDMYRHLQKVTPYRFKKIQDASITDGGDVMYFHKDRFDAALLADMAAHCAAKGVV